MRGWTLYVRILRLQTSDSDVWSQSPHLSVKVQWYQLDIYSHSDSTGLLGELWHPGTFWMNEWGFRPPYRHLRLWLTWVVYFIIRTIHTEYSKYDQVMFLAIWTPNQTFVRQNMAVLDVSLDILLSMFAYIFLKSAVFFKSRPTE